MTVCQNELVIDFGEVGFHYSKHRFRVRLDSRPLTHLIEAAKNAHRVYELLLIERPGDIWAYTWVFPEQLSPRVADRVARLRAEHASRNEGRTDEWPEGAVPFLEFDELFHWAWEDTDPEDSAWLTHRGSSVMQTYAEQSLAIVREAQSRLDGNDHLLRHIAVRARAGKHPYCYLDRRVAIARCRESIPNEPSFSSAFYEKLDELLRDGDLASIAYRGTTDYRLLRLLATEQRRRAERTGHAVGNALHLSALASPALDNEAWESEIWFFDEGLAHGDLCIEEGRSRVAATIKELVEVHHRVRGKYILSARDEGEIAGFEKEAGEGWVLYRTRAAYSRRKGLERIQSWRRSRLGPVLRFAEEGATLFDFEKAVIVIGPAVAGPARSLIALTVAEWQAHGGNPAVIVCGAHVDFERAGCRDVHVLPEGALAARSAEEWLMDILARRSPWIDAVLALRAPAWATLALVRRINQQEGPWRPWIVATPDVTGPSADLTLAGDLDSVLQEALERARSARPTPL